jgi:alkanesulfonate monooxygenase SsuD/methylene tetrahydromethanopterin reductase-like flavin-dependent oxidoreductase (luciferase family)
MREVEFGTTGFYPAFDGVRRAQLAESQDFDIQGFSENHSRATDCFGEMRDAARATERVKLACGPVNFVTRHPGVIAAGIIPIQILSKGRAICNVASGDSAVAAAGRQRQRIADMERDIAILRTYLDNGVVEYDNGKTSRLEWADELSWDYLPIQMVASGPRAIALAARRADRICLGIGTNPERVRWALNIIDDEIARHGRDRERMRIGLFAPIAITADRISGRRTIRTRVSAWAHMQSGTGTDLSQQPEILRKVTSAMRNSYDYSFHRPGAPEENPNSALCDEEFGDWMGIGGPVSYCIDRMGALVELGIDFFMTSLFNEERDTYFREVMPVVRKLRSPAPAA